MPRRQKEGFRGAIVGVLGPKAHYPPLYWAQNLSRGLGLSEEEKTPSRGPILVNDQVSLGL